MLAKPASRGGSSSTSRLIALTVASVGVATLVVHVLKYPVLSHDDAFISLRYTQRLLAGEGLTWTEGQPVEGYSNLLWVLGCALLATLGVELVHTPVVLGVSSAIATVLALVYAFPPRTWKESLPAFAGAMFVALTGPIGLWAVTGLEGCLVAALLAWSLVLIRPLLRDDADWQHALSAGVPLALLCLTRPDGPIFTAAACAFVLVRGRTRDAAVQAVALATVPGLAVLGQLAFRLAYYGDWVPNTARAKVAFAFARVQSGSECVADAGASAWALWVPAALALYVAWRDPERRPRILLSATLLAAWTTYATTIVCEPYGFRMLIPCYVLLAFLVADALDWLQSRGQRERVIGWLVTLAFLGVYGRAQQAEPGIVLARTERPPVTAGGATIGTTLREAFGDDDPLLAVDAAGAIPFYSEMRSLDMLGLNDAHIARRRGTSFGEGAQGHELGDGAYVLSKEPDLIVAQRLGRSRLAFAGGREMEADPRFEAHYRAVRFRGNHPTPLDFYAFTRVDGRTGIERTDDQARIPGYLFATRRGTVANIGENGTLGASIAEYRTGTLSGVAMPAGKWTLETRGSGTMSLSAESVDGTLTATRTERGLELVIPMTTEVDLDVQAASPVFLEAVVVLRAPP